MLCCFHALLFPIPCFWHALMCAPGRSYRLMPYRLWTCCTASILNLTASFMTWMLHSSRYVLGVVLIVTAIFIVTACAQRLLLQGVGWGKKLLSHLSVHKYPMCYCKVLLRQYAAVLGSSHSSWCKFSLRFSFYNGDATT